MCTISSFLHSRPLNLTKPKLLPMSRISDCLLRRNDRFSVHLRHHFLSSEFWVLQSQPSQYDNDLYNGDIIIYNFRWSNDCHSSPRSKSSERYCTSEMQRLISGLEGRIGLPSLHSHWALGKRFNQWAFVNLIVKQD